MFGFKRRRAIEAAIDQAKPLLRSLRATGIDPRTLWSEPYFLGFMQAYLARRIRVASRDTVTGPDLLRALGEAFAALSGGNGADIVRRTTPLINERDPAYAEGFNNAEKIILIAHGSRAFEGDPEVARAIEVAHAVAPDLVSTGLADDKSSGVAAVLLKRYLHDRLRERMRATQ